jgi:replicative DNA helicase
MAEQAGTVLTIPVDVVGEQVCIAAAVVSDERRAGLVRRIAVEQMQHPTHKAIWEAMHELVRRNLSWDVATVQGLFGDRVDVAYVESLVAQRPDLPVDLDHHVDRVQWDACRATAARGPLSQLLEALRDPRAGQARTQALSRQLAEALGEYRDRRFLRDPSALVRSLGDELDDRQKGIAVFPFGIDAIDKDEEGRFRLAPGAKPGHVTVLTGCSGSGKSTLGCRMALGLARQRRRVLYGAWEMSDKESIELIAVMSLAEQDFRDDLGMPISRGRLMEGSFDDTTKAAVKRRASELGQYIRFFDNPFHLAKGEKQAAEGNFRNLDLVHQMIADTESDVFIADLFERCMEDVKPEVERRTLWRAKSIAQETRSHLVLLAQQKLKEVEKLQDTHPTRANIIGSSAWVDVGDLILGVHRAAQWKNVPDDVVDVDILKRRFGRYPIRIEVKWDGDRAWFGSGTTVPYERPGSQSAASEMTEFEEFAGKDDGAPPKRRRGRR